MPDHEVVRVGLSGFPPETHREFGREISRAIAEIGRRCIFVASGDLSHKLTEEGPYGFAEEGPQLDERLCSIFSQGKLEELFALDDSFCDRAAECGVRSFQIMAGVLDQESISFSSELLSYEGPFGVGYAVAAFEVLKPIHDANCTETETECHQ